MNPELSLRSWLAIIAGGCATTFLLVSYLPSQLWLSMPLLAITLIVSGAVLVAAIRRV